MATISATSTSATAIQASLAKTRLAQALREADQAQSTANDLRAKPLILRDFDPCTHQYSPGLTCKTSLKRAVAG